VILFFAVGLFFVARNLTTKNLFLLIFGITSVYFAASMVRLLILLAPAFAMLASMGIIGISKPFVELLKEPPRLNVKKKFGLEHVGKEFSSAAIFLIFRLVAFLKSTVNHILRSPLPQAAFQLFLTNQ
jgi:asparagine N-glycosylation enzyme membrane subunit Stt3